MTIVRVGATEKYTLGWEAAFGKRKAGSAKPAAKTVSAKVKAAGKKKSKKKK